MFSRSSEDLVHRLFVCIAGVADQLQTNFASDLRNILKCVFLMNSSQIIEDAESKAQSSVTTNESTMDNTLNETMETGDNQDRQQESLPEYEEDIEETILTHDRSTQNYLLSFVEEICGRMSPKYKLVHIINCQYQDSHV